MPTALITGAGRGIGLEVARELARDGFDVLMGLRDPSRAPEVSGARLEQLDVASPRSIEALARRLAGRGGLSVTLHTLIRRSEDRVGQHRHRSGPFSACRRPLAQSCKRGRGRDSDDLIALGKYLLRA